MSRLFEVPYNFDESLIQFYKRYISNISYIFLPPFKDDLTNTRTYIESDTKGCCYMPKNRTEYEGHIRLINGSGLKFIVLWQDRNNVMSREMLEYYCRLGASGFTIANDINAKIIKDYRSNLVVICSIIQRRCRGITCMDFKYYDYIVMYFPFNRALDVLKQLAPIKEKMLLIPNTFCHTDCPGIHHWFIEDYNFNPVEDCPAIKDIKNSAYIYPEHLYLFDNFIGGYKLEGREYPTELIIIICEMYFRMKSDKGFLKGMLKRKLADDLQKSLDMSQLEVYYNVKTRVLKKIV